MWLDKDTNLEWFFYDMQGIWDRAKALPAGELEDETWRVPTIAELMTIIDYTKFDPAVKKGCPLGSLLVWASDEYANSKNHAWTVSLEDGGLYPATKTNKRDLLVVRDGKRS